jgi:hypothetical protein
MPSRPQTNMSVWRRRMDEPFTTTSTSDPLEMASLAIYEPLSSCSLSDAHEVDVLVIGAGLTGSSTVYHLSGWSTHFLYLLLVTIFIASSPHLLIWYCCSSVGEPSRAGASPTSVPKRIMIVEMGVIASGSSAKNSGNCG